MCKQRYGTLVNKREAAASLDRTQIAWDPNEEQRLIGAMLDRGNDPTSVTISKERWGQISEKLPGRSGRACRERMKKPYMKDLLRGRLLSKSENNAVPVAGGLSAESASAPFPVPLPRPLEILPREELEVPWWCEEDGDTQLIANSASDFEDDDLEGDDDFNGAFRKSLPRLPPFPLVHPPSSSSGGLQSNDLSRTKKNQTNAQVNMRTYPFTDLSRTTSLLQRTRRLWCTTVVH